MLKQDMTRVCFHYRVVLARSNNIEEAQSQCQLVREDGRHRYSGENYDMDLISKNMKTSP